MMKNNPLVSIITPCYNGEEHLDKFLNSILDQTFSDIELIFVNDGSSDRTEEIFLSYRESFEQKGIKLKYIFQENKGLGGAINTGLRHVKGKYLCWPDADDYLEPESVDLRVRVLEDNPEYAIVTSDAYIRNNGDDLSVSLISDSFKNNNDPNQFYYLLNGESILCSGTHLVRSNVFFETHPAGQIYPAKRGQNYQMLLPVFFKYRRYFLDKPLYNYVIRENSMSKTEDFGFKEKRNTYSNQKAIILKTLSDIEMSENERLKCVGLVEERYSKLIFNSAYNFGEYKALEKEFINLLRLKKVNMKILTKYVISEFQKTFLKTGSAN